MNTKQYKDGNGVCFPLSDGLGTSTLSKNIDCPFCIAQAGEDCWIEGQNGKTERRSDVVHIQRVMPNNTLDS
jgi:hypothetical protein